MTLQKNNRLSHTINIIDWIDQNVINFFQTKEDMTKEEIIENISSIVLFNPKMSKFDFAVSYKNDITNIDSQVVDDEENAMIAKCICNILNCEFHLQKAIDTVKGIIPKYENQNFTTTVYYTIGNAIVTYEYEDEDKEIISVAIPVTYHIDIIVDGKKVWSWDDYKKQLSENKEKE